MVVKKTFFLVIIISCCSAISFAQRIFYSQLFEGKHSKFYYIAGKVGNSYHIWKTTQSGIRMGKEKIAIDIIILSDHMRIIDEKTLMIEEPEAHSVTINFAPFGAFYYAKIDFYNSGIFIRQRIFKIDENGAIIDSTILPNKFPQKALTVNHTSFDSAVIGRANWTYMVTTKQINQDDTSVDTQSLFHKLLDTAQTEMIVRKKHYPPDTIAPTEIRYRSSKFNYHFPKVILDSNGILWVCASRKRFSESKDSSNSIFLVKLDSNLNELSGGAKFIKSNFFDPNAQELFNPQEIFIVNKQLFLISIGGFPQTFYYSKYGGAHRESSYEIYQNNLLRITQLDESMNLLYDTLINLASMGSQILPYATSYSIQDSSINMLCFQRFPYHMNGIKRYKISKNHIEESDMQVDPKNEYLTLDALWIDKDIYIMPFFRKGKIGFMKWTNTSTGN